MTVVASVAVCSGAVQDPTPRAVIDVSATADGHITFVHRGGATHDVSRLTGRVRVDGDAVAHQPPVPFFGAPGYRGAPIGPFNAAIDGEWTAGERAGVSGSQG